MDALRHYGIDAPVADVVTVGDPVGYRNRIRMKVEHGKVQFFNAAKPSTCAVLHPQLKRAIDTLITITEAQPSLLDGMTHLELRTSDADDRVGLVLSHEAHHLDQVAAALPGHWRLSYLGAPDQPTLRYDLGSGVTMDVPIDAFVQVNSVVNRAIVEHVVAQVPSDASTFVDLYAGAGNFSLPLLRCGLTGLAVEQTRSAIRQLASATQDHGLEVAVGAVEAAQEWLPVADVVVVNPARAGLKDVRQWVAERAASTLIYISCRPETLAPDLVSLTADGLKPRGVTPFNMFPGTDHVETVVVLSR